MSSTTRGRGRSRTLATSVLTVALALPVAAFTAAPAPAAPTATAPAPAATAGTHTVEDATFTWGISGYAQRGIFGPWRIFDLEGDAALLTGSVSGGSQTEYAVDPVPATSMPASTPQGTPNAVTFTGGAGTVDPASGEGEFAWSGGYTVNPYPAIYGAPDEIYSDPELTVAADGSGEVTMEVTIGAGRDMNGDPTDPVDLGRVEVLDFSAGDLTGDTGADGSAAYRVAPDYQGVAYAAPEGESAQATCTSGDGATGWWGAWPAEFVDGMAASVRPHYYSTSCGGMQDTKPPLPFDVTYTPVEVAEPSVSLDTATAAPDGSTSITVTGTDFDPAASTATRPPLAGKPGGVYITFGRFADTWRPSQGATGSARPNAAVRWAVKAADMATVGGPGAGAVELTDAGGFTATLPIDKALADQKAADARVTGGRYGIYTYAGGGAVTPAYETFTPVDFTATPTVRLRTPTQRQAGAAFDTVVTVAAPAGWGTPTGRVRVFSGGQAIGAADLAEGRAVIPTSLTTPGERTLTARYLGAEFLAPAVAQATVPVIKARSRLTATVRNAPVTTTDRAEVQVSVANPYDASLTASGDVRVFEGERVLVRRTALGSDGTVVLTLPRLAAGAHTLRVDYLGSSRQESVSKDVGLRVR